MTATMTVNPPVLGSFVLNPNQVKGGISSVGTVTLTGPAPSGGMIVTLASSNKRVGTVPASVTVAAGQTTATFSITTSPVPFPRTTTISAKSGSTTIKALLTVTH
jgi:hypothetical protein